jgi:hypothetical protein
MAQVLASEIDSDACSIDCLHPELTRPLLGRSLGSDVAAIPTTVGGD